MAAEKQIWSSIVNQHSSQGQTMYITVFIQPKFTVLYHLGLLKDTGGLPMMKSPNDTVLGTHPVITGHRTACWELRVRMETLPFPYGGACLCTEAALTCSPKGQGKGECEAANGRPAPQRHSLQRSGSQGSFLRVEHLFPDPAR